MEFKLPPLGENIDSGTVVKFLVEPGETIEEEQPIAELETGKTTLEVPSTISGVIKELLVREGETINVGQALFSYESAGATSETAQVAAPGGEASVKVMASAEAKAAETQDAAPPAPVQASGTSHTEYVSAQQVQQTGAGTATTSGTAVGNGRSGDGTGSSNGVSTGASPNGGAVGSTSPDSGTNGASANGGFTATAAGMPGMPVPAVPSIRRLARELGVDVHQVQGSGPGGRISESDVKNFAKNAITQAKAAPSPAPAANGGAPATVAAPVVTLPDFSKYGGVERKPLSNIRKATAEQMARSWSTVPHVTQFDMADVTELEVFRKKFASRAEAVGGKLTVTAITLKAVSAAIKRFPQFGASIDMAANELVFKNYCHIGVAVDTERGLLVPVIRDVDKKSVVQLAGDLAQISQKARDKKVGLEDMQGGVFTITNLGGIGGTNFTPIVNTPEVAILGMARSKMEPKWMDGEFKPRLMLPLALSYDHRVIDGADGARFLRFIVELLEEPILLSLEG